jgi:hypothetical protein
MVVMTVVLCKKSNCIYFSHNPYANPVFAGQCGAGVIQIVGPEAGQASCWTFTRPEPKP